jgi:peptidoglycan/LPS O-acetylase OafA/YrhL
MTPADMVPQWTRSGPRLKVAPDICRGGPMRKHNNAFDLVRLMAACLVVWHHQFNLMGLPEPIFHPMNVVVDGGVGVAIFFALSGYLNTTSAARHRSAAVFLFNRALRIYPALIVCVLLTAVFGLFVTSDIRTYLSPQLLTYLAKNSTLLFGVGVRTPGVFTESPFPNALNGSLWTLPYEIKMYLALACCLAVVRYNLVFPAVVFAGAVLFTALALFFGFWATFPQDFGLGFSTLFLAGCTLASIRSFLGLPLGIGILVFVALTFLWVGQNYLSVQLLVAAAVVSVGSIRLPIFLRLPLDLSFGIYIYAFPVQQLSSMLFSDFWIALTFSASITFVLALLSALFIEKPALQLKDKFPSFDFAEKLPLQLRKLMSGAAGRKNFAGSRFEQ